ncbi:MAG: PIN domain-containing protein [Candidatus Coatesbacteria bacterium]
MILLDTSAFYALANAGDPRHREATAILEALRSAEERLVVHSYVVVETAALLQDRSGHATAARFLRDAAAYETVWVDAEIHRDGLALFAQLKARDTSLVDCVSFSVMRRRGITTAFAFDRHFLQQGFRLAEPR